MQAGLSRKNLRVLAELRLHDAQALFDAERFSACYYMAGYAVELGLKACIARNILAETIPPKRLVEKTYVHDFATLVGVAGLAGELQTKEKDALFQENWGIVAQWSPDSRYTLTDRSKAHYMLSAISDVEYGIMSWIKQHW